MELPVVFVLNDFDGIVQVYVVLFDSLVVFFQHLIFLDQLRHDFLLTLLIEVGVVSVYQKLQALFQSFDLLLLLAELSFQLIVLLLQVLDLVQEVEAILHQRFVVP